jgi:hypothetical protein
MPKPACPKCKRFFRPKRNGVFMQENMPIGEAVRPGVADEASWHPYKIWACDEWWCQGCGAVILFGYGERPVAEHYESDFASVQERTRAKERQINDC